MPMDLTGLIPTINAGLHMVSRELIGFIPNVSRDATADMAAIDQTVRSPIAPAGTLEDITPGLQPANTGGQTITYHDVTITKSKASPILWTGEEQLSVSKDGIINVILRDQFAESFRALANAVEADLAAEYKKATRAYGTAGTTPFGTADNFDDFAQSNKILDENGAPASGRVMIVDSSARARLEGRQPTLFRVNEAGDGGQMLRNREMRRLQGFTMGYSAGIKRHTAGDAAGYQLNGAASEGALSIPVDTGTGTLGAGDVFSIAGDDAHYVTTSGIAAPGNIGVTTPGLVTDYADNAALTFAGGYTPNLFFHQNALLLATRLPAMPEGGDSADDVTTLQDPVSGIVFQVAVYRMYKQVKFEIGLSWGVGTPNAKWLGTLMG